MAVANRVIGGLLLAGCLAPAAGAAPVLARLELDRPARDLPVPVYAQLRDGQGVDYVIAFAEPDQLKALPCRILDTHATPGDCVLARLRVPGGGPATPAAGQGVYDDGVQRVIAASAAEAAALVDQGFAVARLPAAPLRWPAAPAAPGLHAQDTGYDPLIAGLVSRIESNRLIALMRRLTGQEPEVASGNVVTLATRHTSSGSPIQAATDYACEHLQSLGYSTRFRPWSSGRNIEATLPGSVTSNEIVVLVAHLDDMPSGSLAPGADDNGSGTASVLMAAEILRQYTFERTLRFLLVTGEEQGLLGSSAYAAAAAATGDQIVAVLNLDMVAWDSNNDGIMDVYTRSTGNPGYSNDLAVAVAFTNAAARYAMPLALVPRIFADSSMWASDHSSFWNAGYPAVLVIEADHSDAYRDFNAYYHSTADTLDHVNVGFFTSIARASIAAAAQLARPVAHNPVDIVEVASMPSSAAPTPGASTTRMRHEPGAAETGPDPCDAEWSAAAIPTNTAWLRLQTRSDSAPLCVDARPPASETVFSGTLYAVSTGAGSFGCSNRLRFDFLTPPMTDRVYVARIQIPAAFTGDSNAFACVTNLRPSATAGCCVTLPPLAHLSNGVAYGRCDIAARYVAASGSNLVLGVPVVSEGATQVAFSAAAQAATRVEDTVEASTNLARPDGWQVLASATNDAVPTPGSFDTGWMSVTQTVGASAFTNAPRAFFRLRRQWLAP